MTERLRLLSLVILTCAAIAALPVLGHMGVGFVVGASLYFFVVSGLRSPLFAHRALEPSRFSLASPRSLGCSSNLRTFGMASRSAGRHRFQSGQ